MVFKCNVTDTYKACVCNNGYAWNISVCFFFPTCNDSAPCDCVVVTDEDIPFCEEPFSGPSSIVRTDHKPLVHLLKVVRGFEGDVTPRILRWILSVLEFYFKMEYLKELRNVVVDCLSRLPTERIVEDEEVDVNDACEIQEGMAVNKEEWDSAMQDNLVLEKVKENIRLGWPQEMHHDDQMVEYWRVREELSTLCNRVIRRNRIIPPVVLHDRIVQLAQQGHPGRSMTKRRIRQTCWWPNLDNKVEDLWVGDRQADPVSDALLTPGQGYMSLQTLTKEKYTGQPVNVTGYFILNETYNGVLSDATSKRYAELKYNITGELIKGYAKNSQLLNVTFVGFSALLSGVAANYTLALRAPISGELFEASNNAASGSIPNMLSSKATTKGVSGIVSAPPTTVKYHEQFMLQCQMNASGATVTWFLKSNTTTNMISSRGNAQITLTSTSTTTVSTLTILQADQLWEGTYMCQFSSGSVLHEDETDVAVVLLPTEIITIPLQQSVPKKTSSLFLKCCIQNDGEVYKVTWTYNNIITPVLPDSNNTQCYTLVTPTPEDDTIYTCTFTNPSDQSKSNTIPITVIKDKFCKSDFNGWEITKAGISAVINCPPGKIGNMTRICSAAGEWLSISDNCISAEMKAALDNVANLQQGLGNPQEKVPLIVTALNNPEAPSISNAAEVKTMVNILGKISNVSSIGNNSFDTAVVTNFLSLASNITTSRFASSLSRNQGAQASSMLKTVETFSQLLKSDNQSFDITVPSIQVKGESYEPGLNLSAYQKTFDFNLSVSMFIDENTIADLTTRGNFTITSVAYASLGDILPKSTGKFEGSTLNSIVQSTSIKFNNINHDLGEFGVINMTFHINNSNKDSITHCVFWDFNMPPAGVGGWSDGGCSGWSDENTTYCICNHLTSFAVLMSINPEPLPLIDEITYVGLAVSIISLCICLFMEWIVWKYVARSNISYFRHTSLVNISFSLLCADVCFLAASFPIVKTSKFICLSITFLSHFFYLSLFFWTLCQSMMLLHQLVFIFHHLRKKVFLSLSFVLGYVFPAAIAIGTFFYFYPKSRYTHQSICWLNPDSGAILTFAIPAGSIIVINFLTLIVVISKLTRPSVSDASQAEDKETAKSIMKAILVLTPVFGLTWAFGFALLTDLDQLTKMVFTYGFAGMNAFQGFFILLTTCFTEKKVRDAFCKRVSGTTSTMSTSEVQTKMSYSSSLKK
ncbi:adhesion G-protein coupled receptor F3-like [Lissotriton helveticus]